jgi:hypothetical protein
MEQLHKIRRYFLVIAMCGYLIPRAAFPADSIRTEVPVQIGMSYLNVEGNNNAYGPGPWWALSVGGGTNIAPHTFLMFSLDLSEQHEYDSWSSPFGEIPSDMEWYRVLFRVGPMVQIHLMRNTDLNLQCGYSYLFADNSHSHASPFGSKNTTSFLFTGAGIERSIYTRRWTLFADAIYIGPGIFEKKANMFVAEGGVRCYFGRPAEME